MYDEIRAWVDVHLAQGHEARVTRVEAPAGSIGSCCWTCGMYGPRYGGEGSAIGAAPHVLQRRKD